MFTLYFVIKYNYVSEYKFIIIILVAQKRAKTFIEGKRWV